MNKFTISCDKWNDFTPLDWADLICCSSQYIDRCDKWFKFNRYEWGYFLDYQPQLALMQSVTRYCNGYLPVLPFATISSYSPDVRYL